MLGFFFKLNFNGGFNFFFIRFELKYFDPFLVLDEFSGGFFSFFLKFLFFWSEFEDHELFNLFFADENFWVLLHLQLLLLLDFLIIHIEVFFFFFF